MNSFIFKPAVQGLQCIHQGKVRDTFAIPFQPHLLLVVATDRVSTHNIVHESTIPLKGQALTALTVFWMEQQFKDINTHLFVSGEAIYQYLPAGTYPPDLHHRAVIVEKLEMIPIEFIFRSRMAGSLWKDSYSKGIQNPYGVDLPSELTLMSSFDMPIFTPTDKSDTDDPLKAEEIVLFYPEAYLLARKVYERGRIFAATKGIEIIDGKFEMGFNREGEVVLADECLTPDSCRFVRADEIVVGKEPSWLDKQHLREEAERIWNGGKKVPLAFSEKVCAETSARYGELVQAFTGFPLEVF